MKTLYLLMSGLCLAAIGGIVGGWTALHLASKPDLPDSLSARASQPAMEFLDAYACPRGLKKIIIERGVEDSYARSNEEPARYHEVLQSSPYYISLIEDKIGAMSVRDYDMPGRDRVLFDYITLPEHAVGGAIVIRGTPAADISTDTLSLRVAENMINETWFDIERAKGWGVGLTDLERKLLASDGDALYFAELVQLTRSTIDGMTIMDFGENWNQTEPLELVLSVQDDMQVDFVGVAICQAPAEEMGVTFNRINVPEEIGDYGLLSCGSTYQQPVCNAIVGNTACTEQLPLACFTDPKEVTPTPTIPHEGLARYYVAGNITFTEPVRGDSFETASDAAQFCAAVFGAGSRPVSFHDAGGYSVAYTGEAAPAPRVWINVTDQPRANCWALDGEQSP